MKITLKNYEKLLSQIQIHVKKTQNNIARQKVEMAWNIGKEVEEHLKKNKESEKSNYGKNLFEKLESDVGITQNILYRMRAFYKTYPKLPKDEAKLNWSHYRVLSGVKKESDRKFLEDLTKKENLDAESLRKKTKESKTLKTNKTPNTKNEPRLLPRRGELFNYNLVEPSGVSSTCIDCGFGIFKRFDEKMPPTVKIVETVKKEKNYKLKKSQANRRKLNAYKAYLGRVVDGDTIHVILDLGFDIFHEEILRLRAINAAESGTKEGEKSTLALKRILKNIPFFVVKTSGTDQHGRYVADVFLADEKGEMEAQKVADEGVFLNQLLVEKGLVELVG
ncbi:MAG: hypothetical protein KGP29_07715 [Proteobacteria bacterium]|nr:hypothetical protein [Pseudomonadota bacterium]